MNHMLTLFNFQVICSRCKDASTSLKERIEMLLEGMYVFCLRFGTPKKFGHPKNWDTIRKSESNYFSSPKDLGHTKNFKV